MIATGRLGPGQRLPSETELCAQLGVSRSSLREAVRMLGALGVVESRHGSGTYVSSLDAPHIVGALSLTVGLLPLSGLLEIYSLRQVLEAHAAAQAAARLDGAVLSEMREILQELESEDEPERASALDHRFHSLVDEQAGNPTLASLLRVFRSRSRAYQIYGEDTAEVKLRSDQGHRAILNALADRDPTAAASAASAHVAQTRAWLQLLQPRPATNGEE